MTSGLKLSINLKILNLDGTNLDSESLIDIVKSTGKSIESLDISHNPRIGLEGY